MCGQHCGAGQVQALSSREVCIPRQLHSEMNSDKFDIIISYINKITSAMVRWKGKHNRRPNRAKEGGQAATVERANVELELMRK
jgi:hypothetical protein